MNDVSIQNTNQPTNEFDNNIKIDLGNKGSINGYRHTGTGVIFLSTSTQTINSPKKSNGKIIRKPNCVSRDTQTCNAVSRGTQSAREVGCQTLRPNLNFDTRVDRYITAKERNMPYVKYHIHHIVFLQKIWRGSLHRMIYGSAKTRIKNAKFVRQ